jgi:hypothetical protein
MASQGQDRETARPIGLLSAEVVELPVLCTAEKSVPFPRGEAEHRAGGVLGVAHADAAIGQAGNLDAVAVRERE